MLPLCCCCCCYCDCDVTSLPTLTFAASLIDNNVRALRSNLIRCFRCYCCCRSHCVLVSIEKGFVRLPLFLLLLLLLLWHMLHFSAVLHVFLSAVILITAAATKSLSFVFLFVSPLLSNAYFSCTRSRTAYAHYCRTL